jgi:hypothetical protein
MHRCIVICKKTALNQKGALNIAKEALEVAKKKFSAFVERSIEATGQRSFFQSLHTRMQVSKLS